MAFDEITIEEIEEVEMLLNKRPRKVLKYQAPIEAFEARRSDYTNVALHT